MKNIKKALALMLTVALCVSLAVPAVAANEKGITYSAELDKASVTVSANEQSVTMTVTGDENFNTYSIGMTVVVPDGWTVESATNANVGSDFEFNPATNKIVGAANGDVTGDLIVVVKYKIPANTPAGDYELGIEALEITENWGDVWEDGGSASAILTVVCPHTNTEVRDASNPSCNTAGYTGDTWCLDCETKIADGEEINATGDHVDADGKWESNDAQHFHTCGCGEKFDNADHVYNKSVAEEQYLASEATCTAKATYYKSCVCGKAGTETFESGKVLPHTYEEVAEAEFLKSAATCTKKAVYYKSCSCGAKSTATFEYGEFAEHVFDKEVATAKYLNTTATCTAKATYFKSCVCGEKGTETFEYGALAKHVYDQTVAEDAYMKSAATCTDKAVYYKSCVCGAAGTTTFVSGETLPHTFDQEVVATKYLKSEATCMAKAVYYKSCACGAVGTETFEAGEKDMTNHVSDGSNMDYNETQHWGTCECGTPIEAENHKGGKATCVAAPICSVCGQPYGEADPDAHKWDKGVVTVEPTEKSEGLKIFTCTNEGCGQTKEQVLSKKNPVSNITPSNPEGEEPAEPVLPFTDVKKSDWFYNDVAFAYANGLMNGTGNNKFSPAVTTDRAMIVTVLWRMEGSPVVDSAVKFIDVETGAWYAAAIDWASANGIVNGYGDGKFGPTAQITREQIMAILNRYAVYKGWAEDTAVSMVAQYTCSIWAENNVNWADLSGLLADLGVDVTDMTAMASRAELAAYLSRFMENIAK